MKMSARILIPLMMAPMAMACGSTSGGGGQGGGYIGGAVGVTCLAATQAEGCYAVGTQHNRMTCDPATNKWALLETCAPGAYCSETANPALPGKMMTACNAGRVAPTDAGATDTGVKTDTVTSNPVCGDGKCEAPENSTTCAADCKAGGPVCGDGKCEAPETTATCAADCKAAGPVCGDGKCEAPETTATCAADCKAAGPVCGDGKCEEPENASSCAKDCKKPADDSCVGKCGKFKEGAKCNCDDQCAKYNDCCADIKEVCGSTCTKNCADKQCGDDGCGGSCGSCTGGKVCKNFVCKAGSTSTVCPNGKCEEGETEESCPADCKDCEGNWTLGSTFYKSQDTKQLGQPCNPKGAPKNCPDGLFINFKDTGECICIVNCSAFSNIKKGDNCTKSGSWKCMKIKATNASANSALACVPVKWGLCTE